MLTNLLTHIKKYVSLTDVEEDIIRNSLVTISLSNKVHLLKAGQICHDHYFVLKGCLRMYAVTEKGSEHTLQFAIENWWISDYMSMEKGSPASFNIQAVEDANIACLDKNNEQILFKKVPQLEHYFRIMHRRAFAAAQHRIHYIYSLTGAERYHHFSNTYPEFVQRIPLYMLASFLGFTPEFISKIRAQKK
ncbi:MAG TPA: Crp/Fnr family transcriptional regulator [Cytophagales bacterium]|nr:Crp/Fnr family transcriptional regulator [Cytophagales bacterium]